MARIFNGNIQNIYIKVNNFERKLLFYDLDHIMMLKVQFFEYFMEWYNLKRSGIRGCNLLKELSNRALIMKADTDLSTERDKRPLLPLAWNRICSASVTAKAV